MTANFPFQAQVGLPTTVVCACLFEHTQCITPQLLAAEVPPDQRALVRPEADATVHANTIRHPICKILWR
jgi:hypothetical protein